MSDEISDLSQRIEALEKKIAQLNQKIPEDRLSIIAFSGDFDKLMAALILATGGAAMGSDVHILFTFWGTSILKLDAPQQKDKLFLQKIFGRMMPKGPEKLPLSKMNFAGMGPMMMKSLMTTFKTPSPSELLEMADEMGVQFYICQMSMDLMGIKKEEIRPLKNLNYCGVAKFLEISQSGSQTLFI